MNMPWWSQNEALNQSIPTLSRLRLYVDNPPDFTYDFAEWCCAREQLWAEKKGLTEKVLTVS